MSTCPLAAILVLRTASDARNRARLVLMDGGRAVFLVWGRGFVEAGGFRSLSR